MVIAGEEGLEWHWS